MKKFICLVILILINVFLNSCNAKSITEEEVELINTELCIYLHSNGRLSSENYSTLKSHLSKSTSVTVNIDDKAILDKINVKHIVSEFDSEKQSFITKIYYTSVINSQDFCNYEMEIISDRKGNIMSFTDILRGYC